MDQIDIAVHDTVHKSEIKCKEIAALLGMSKQVLINKANSQNDFNKLTLREAVAIQKITGSTAIHEAVAMELGINSLVLKEPEKPVSLVEALLTVVSECGDVSRATREAMEDGRLTEREKADMQREVAEAIDSLMAMRLAIKEHK